MKNEKDQWVRQSTAAKMANMTVQSFRYHVRQKHIEPVGEIDGCQFFDRRAIQSWLFERGV